MKDNIISLSEKRKEKKEFEKVVLSGVWEAIFQSILKVIEKDPDAVSFVLITWDKNSNTIDCQAHSEGPADVLVMIEKVKHYLMED